MKNVVPIALICVFFLVFAGSIGGLVVRFSVDGGANKVSDYKDLISIILTAISLLLALVTVIISVFAVLGWNAISEKAAESAKKFLDDGFENGGKLETMLKSRVDSFSIEHIEKLKPDDALFKAILARVDAVSIEHINSLKPESELFTAIANQVSRAKFDGIEQVGGEE